MCPYPPYIVVVFHDRDRLFRIRRFPQYGCPIFRLLLFRITPSEEFFAFIYRAGNIAIDNIVPINNILFGAIHEKSCATIGILNCPFFNRFHKYFDILRESRYFTNSNSYAMTHGFDAHVPRPDTLSISAAKASRGVSNHPRANHPSVPLKKPSNP